MSVCCLHEKNHLGLQTAVPWRLCPNSFSREPRIRRYRVTDSEFEGDWTPEEEYLDASLFRQYSRALYFSLVITYGNDLSEWEVRMYSSVSIIQSRGRLSRLRAVVALL